MRSMEGEGEHEPLPEVPAEDYHGNGTSIDMQLTTTATSDHHDSDARWQDNDEPDTRWQAFAEPVPDWNEAETLYGLWWEVHIYGTACLYILIAVLASISLICLIRLKLKSRSQTGYFTVLNFLLIFFGLDRAVFMLVDAYNVQNSLAPVVAYLLLSIGLPCLTSAFYLIFRAYVLATTLMAASSAIFNIRTLVIIIVVHFVVSVALDVTAGLVLGAAYLLLVCQIIFILWGYILSVLYFYLFYRIYQGTVGTRNKLREISFRSIRSSSAGFEKQSEDGSKSKTASTSTGAGLPEIPEVRVSLGAKLILASAILLFIIATLYFYGIFGVYAVHTMSRSKPAPWPWWGYEFGLRLCEIALCVTIWVASLHPLVKNYREQKEDTSA